MACAVAWLGGGPELGCVQQLCVRDDCVLMRWAAGMTRDVQTPFLLRFDASHASSHAFDADACDDVHSSSNSLQCVS